MPRKSFGHAAALFTRLPTSDSGPFLRSALRNPKSAFPRLLACRVRLRLLRGIGQESEEMAACPGQDEQMPHEMIIPSMLVHEKYHPGRVSNASGK